MIAIVQLLKEPPSDACTGREDSDLPCALKHGKHGTDRVRMIAWSKKPSQTCPETKYEENVRHRARFKRIAV